MCIYNKTMSNVQLNTTNYASDLSLNTTNPSKISNYALDISLNATNFSGINIQKNIEISFCSIFNKTTAFYFISFLAIYFIFSYSLGYGNIVTDLFIILILVVLYSYYYLFSSLIERRDLLKKIIDNIKEFFEDPKSIFSTIMVIFVLYITIFVSHISMISDSKSFLVTIIESILWLTFILLFIIDIFKFYFGIDLVTITFTEITRLLSLLPSIDCDKEEPKIEIEPVKKMEVFNISNNLYTYDDAQAICKSYDARLATYEEVEHSYNNGSEWCNYGWSDAQMILFPTQQSTWNKLQGNTEHKNDCGRPGVNGGYIANPKMEFGVNCYGFKPEANNNDLTQMNANLAYNHPKSKDDEILDAKVAFWQENKEKMLNINSFNKNKWNEFQKP
jgi:hypothetical protein